MTSSRTRKVPAAAAPTCVELFAGAGGMVLGLELAGFKTVVANEVHADPCKTLSHNFPSMPVLCGSIRDLSGRDLLKFARFNRRKHEVDLVAGGPPCQGYSTAGMKDPADPRNTLIGDFIRVVKELRPRYFLMENVTGLATLHNGRLFERVLEEFNSTGYDFNHFVVFAADHGVPQMRKRLIIFGSRDGKAPNAPPRTHSSQESLDLFGSVAPYVTCGEALEDIPAIPAGTTATRWDRKPETPFQRQMRKGAKVLMNHQASKHRSSTMAYYALVPPGGTALDIPLEVRNGKQGIQRWPVDGLSRTITTEPTDFLHPLLDRIPTVRELARIQTFPDRYTFLGQRTTGNRMRRLGYCSQTQQVGNAVPPALAEALGKTIIRSLQKEGLQTG